MTPTQTQLAALLACTFALTGCKVHELGANISPTQAAHVDPTWVRAAKSCWPMLVNKSDTYVSVNLADPIGFRNTFAAYAPLTDAQLETLAASRVIEAPAADPSLFANPTSALLTRQQAVESAPNTADARDSKSPSPDILCAVHTGFPAEYR